MGHRRLQAANYAAEHRLLARLQYPSWIGRKHLSRHKVSLDEVRTYISAIQAQPWFKAAWSAETRPITVKTSSGASSSNRHERVIKLSTVHRHHAAQAELVTLHELAHMITSDNGIRAAKRADDNLYTAGHTKAWRAHFFTLVSRTFGSKWARRLRDEMDREGGICTCDGWHVSPACREFGCCP